MAVARDICVPVNPSLKDSRATEGWVRIAVFTFLTTLAVALRIVARRLGNVSLWWDDAMMYLAWVVVSPAF